MKKSMNELSFILHRLNTKYRITSYVGLIIVAVAASACYSFRGGSVPDHLHSITIASVVDKSNFGDASYREIATETLIRRFRTDNALQVVDDNGDARLTPVLTSVRDQILNLQQGDLEGQRRMVVSVEVEYFDAVKNKVVWKRTFENFDVYNVADAAEDRKRAAQTAIQRIADDVLLAVVSDW